MSQFWSPQVARLTPYVPGEQPLIDNLVKLNTNENPYPPSPEALAAMAASLGEGLRLYPDPDATALKTAIARLHRAQNIDLSQVFVGNGSDEVLAHVFCALLRHPAPLLFPDITYSFYPVYAELYGIDYRCPALDRHWAICPEDYLDTACGGILFPNPNAPTGHLLGLDAIERIVAGNPDSVVVVDEAYIDFAAETIPSAIALVQQYPNLLVVQTLSKSRALAGLRVGFAIGHPALIEALERVKNSFNSYPLGRLAIAGAAAAIADTAYFDQTRRTIMADRAQLTAALAALGFVTIPSGANFIFTEHPDFPAEILAGKLREHGIVVRHFKRPRIGNHLRISIGTPEQHQRLLIALVDCMN